MSVINLVCALPCAGSADEAGNATPGKALGAMNSYMNYFKVFFNLRQSWKRDLTPNSAQILRSVGYLDKLGGFHPIENLIKLFQGN